jgi:hypothetical protein
MAAAVATAARQVQSKVTIRRSIAALPIKFRTMVEPEGAHESVTPLY